MNRDRALEELKLRIEDEDNIKHSLATEAVMRRLAEYFHEDEELWGLAGLVHDIDIERIQGKMELHGLMGGDILEGLGADKTIVYTVKAHNPKGSYRRRRKIDKALYCAEPISEFIIAVALSLPEKNLEKVDKTLVLKQLEKTEFSREIDRMQIEACSELNLRIEDLVELSLNAIKGINLI